MVTAGRNYSQVPTIEFTGSSGSGASATAVLDSNGGVASVTVVEGGSDYTDSVVVVFVPGTSSSTYNCSTQCKAYINIITNEVVDLSAVNITALSNNCNFDITNLQGGFNDRWCFFVIFGLLIACMPLIYGTTAVVSLSVAKQASFYIPCLILFVVTRGCCYFWLDLQGEQYCESDLFKDDYYWPTSKCGQGFFGYLPNTKFRKAL